MGTCILAFVCFMMTTMMIKTIQVFALIPSYVQTHAATLTRTTPIPKQSPLHGSVVLTPSLSTSI